MYACKGTKALFYDEFCGNTGKSAKFIQKIIDYFMILFNEKLISDLWVGLFKDCKLICSQASLILRYL